ncbi:hypothetical protein P8452_26069 [Trifolium repens]|nr:hypothetical protein P8452_26069 [Trifolium repens]
MKWDLSHLEIIEEFQKCHVENHLKIKLDRCFGAEKAVKRKANFEKTNELKEQLHVIRKENAASNSQ